MMQRNIVTLNHNPFFEAMDLSSDILGRMLVCLVYISRLQLLPLLIQNYWKSSNKTLRHPLLGFTLRGSFVKPKAFYIPHDYVSLLI